MNASSAEIRTALSTARLKRAQRPEDALVMTLADMDLPCCPAIQQAIVERAAHPFYGYQQFDRGAAGAGMRLGEGPQYGESGSADDSDYAECQYRDRAVPGGR